MFIGGIQLLCIGIIGEYISRISADVKKRPSFVIDETNLPGTGNVVTKD
jgi:dolichol-phosphate mannosyltransferase